MKKISTVFIFTLIVSVVLNVIPKGLDGIVFGVIPAVYIFFLLPFIGGILLVLAQDKERSYQYLQTLMVGTLLNSITVVLVGYIIGGLIDGQFYKPVALIYSLSGIFLPFVALSLFGGLIGLVIRGSRLLVCEYFNKYKNYKYGNL